MEKAVRVRFAPSPTGPLHIGGVRTALFNYLFAKSQKGTTILRIEDTDQSRFVKGAEEYIVEALEWCGIEFDESPQKGGEYGPYRQSERKEMYKEYAMKLVNEGKAYYAFDTTEELDAMRERLEAAKVDKPQYNSITRVTMKNSLTLSPEEVQQKLDAGEPYVIRIKVPAKDTIRFNDLVRGNIKVQANTIDDKVLMKSDGMPTYHLANVVDDYLMKISHVIRGEEWLPSAPLHVLLYQFFGWEDSMPAFAHLPLLLKPSGKGKLSKRDGDKLGFSVFPTEWKDPENGAISTGYREDGFLSAAFVNFLALLGWNPGTEQEIFSMEELIEAFSIERIGKSGTQFDFGKAKWFNQQYIKATDDKELGNYLLSELEKENITCSLEKATQVATQMKERVEFPYELWTNAKFYFIATTEYDAKTVKKKWKEDAIKALQQYKVVLADVDTLTAEEAKTKLEEVVTSLEMGLGKVMPALRVALTGLGGGPDLMVLMEILGAQEVVNRINTAIEKLGA